MDFVSENNQNHYPHDWSEALPAVRSNNDSHSLALNPTPFARTFVGAIPRRTSALAVGPSVQAVGLNRPLESDLQNLSLHRGPRLRGADGMEPDPLALLPRFIRYSGDAPRPVHSTCRAYSAEPDGCAEQEV